MQGEVLETTSVGDIAHKPAYFVPGMVLLPYITAKFVFSCRNWLACIIGTYLCVLLGIYRDWSMMLQWCLRLNHDFLLNNVLDTYSYLDIVADSMSVWNLLREFRIRKVHMAVVLNEYGGTVGVSLYLQCTLLFICYLI